MLSIVAQNLFTINAINDTSHLAWALIFLQRRIKVKFLVPSRFDVDVQWIWLHQCGPLTDKLVPWRKHYFSFLANGHKMNQSYSIVFGLASDPVRDLTIDPLQVEYQVGDTIVCSASGNPSPDVIWLGVEGNVTSNVLTVTSNMMGTVSYTCEGTNIVQGVPYQKEILITFQVVGKPCKFLIFSENYHSFFSVYINALLLNILQFIQAIFAMNNE